MSAFPKKVEGHDDELPDEQRKKLEKGPRHTHVDRSLGGDRTGVMVLRAWECPVHSVTVVQGEPCPECGKKLLLD